MGYVFRDGRAKVIELQPFCILLILRLFHAGVLLRKLQQGQAVLCPNPPQELLGSREGAGTGAGSCLPGAVGCLYRNAQLPQNPGVQQAKFKPENNQTITISDFSRFSLAYQLLVANLAVTRN